MNIFPIIKITFVDFEDFRCYVFGHKWNCINIGEPGIKVFECKRCKERRS